MLMLYNSDNFAVVQFDVPPADEDESGTLTRGGYEIVDKFARKEIFLEGAMAQTFKEGSGVCGSTAGCDGHGNSGALCGPERLRVAGAYGLTEGGQQSAVHVDRHQANGGMHRSSLICDHRGFWTRWQETTLQVVMAGTPRFVIARAELHGPEVCCCGENYEISSFDCLLYAEWIDRRSGS